MSDKLKIVVKTDKETDESFIIAQTTNPETVERAKKMHNDNTAYGKNKYGDILGNKSNIEVFDADDVRNTFFEDTSTGGDMSAISI